MGLNKHTTDDAFKTYQPQNEDLPSPIRDGDVVHQRRNKPKGTNNFFKAMNRTPKLQSNSLNKQKKSIEEYKNRKLAKLGEQNDRETLNASTDIIRTINIQSESAGMGTESESFLNKARLKIKRKQGNRSKHEKIDGALRDKIIE